ncbi:MAG: hypothetical protein R2867_25630 [Caldilineaceae bacterium]
MRDHCWPHFMAGNDPAQEPGVRLEIWDDDGSPEWADLYARCNKDLYATSEVNFTTGF